MCISTAHKAQGALIVKRRTLKQKNCLVCSDDDGGGGKGSAIPCDVY